MDLSEISSSGVDPRAHWYYRTKRIPVVEYFESIPDKSGGINIVDVGAGSGFFSDSLADEGGKKIANILLIDPGFQKEETLADARIRGHLARLKAPPKEFKDSLLLFMDVLEHVEDDELFLRSILERCRGRNNVLITAPAFMSLYSSHDVFLKHYRRYDLPTLQRIARGAGIAVTAAYYIYGLIFPLVWIKRRMIGHSGKPASDMRPTPRVVSIFLEWLCRWEFLFRRLNIFFGLTCVIEGVVEREVRQGTS